jgi:hypothetical protein
MSISSIKVHRRATTSREYDAITVVIDGMHFSKDATNARDVLNAKKLAQEHGATYWCDPAVWERMCGGKDLS